METLYRAKTTHIAWNSGSNPTTPEFAAGDTIKIKANVRNIGVGIGALNVKVEFREESQTGTLIGTTTIASIAAGGSAITSIEWTVKSGVSQVCVNVDPDNLIVEVSEENNKACKGTSKVLDSDGDGLTDYDETNGMRTSIGDIIIKTDPNDPDSDGDGLSDGEEMGARYASYYYLNSNPTRIDSDYDDIDDSDEPEFGTEALNSDSDGDRLSDGFEQEIGTDPLIKDTDSDGYNDYAEHYDAEHDPLVYEKRYGVLEIARDVVVGAVLGEWGDSDSIYYFAGWMLSGFLAVGDIRDIAASIVHLDAVGTLLNAIALIPAYGDLGKVVTTVGEFVGKHADEGVQVAAFVFRRMDIQDSVIIRKVIDSSLGSEAADALRGKGFSDDVITKLVKQNIDIKRLNQILEGSKVYDDFPGLNVFVREQLTLEGAVLKGRATVDVKKMVAADVAGKSTAGYLSNLKGAYTEYLAKGDTTGDIVKDLAHINKGGVDYAVKEGNVLKIVEAKARASLSRADIKNYIYTDDITGDLVFSADYAIKELGENYLKDPGTQKQFILYLNGPNSQAIKNSLNLPASVPYTFKDSDGILRTGTVEVIVKAVNQ